MARRKFRRVRRSRVGRKRTRRSRTRASRSRRPRKSISPNTASVIESSKSVFNFGTQSEFYCSLADIAYDRAQKIAKEFQEFRIKWIQLRFQFPFNNYQPGVNTRPYWYIFQDPRNVWSPGFTEQQLLDVGMKARQTPNGMFVMTYKPTVNFNSAELVLGNVQPGPSYARKSPWLPTNAVAIAPQNPWSPNLLRHYGVKWKISGNVPSGTQANGTVWARVCFQFRRPLTQAASALVEEGVDLPMAVGEFVEEVTCAPPSAHVSTEVAEGGSSVTPT